jgi:TolB-like protein/Flp pilus assembly protein TadD
VERSTAAHYRILGPLDESGAVYKAEDPHLKCVVALRFIRTEFLRTPELIERFRREARLASTLNHPHICTIYQVHESADETFVVMEYIHGQALSRIMRSGPLPPRQVVRFAIQLADALAMAHSKGLVHREIKPAKIFITDQGKAKLLGFGLPREDGAEILSYETRDDLFSLGVLLDEMATGRHLFSGMTAPLTFDTIPDVPVSLAEIISRAVHKKKELRYQHAADLLADLKKLQQQLQPRAAQSAKSIAVLPFADMSADRDQEYFCDGMAEELINALVNIEGLHVTSRTSAFQFKGQAMDVAEIGGQLMVSNILEGSVRKSGNRLRITVNLVDVSTDYQVWSEQYDREMQDIFAIQDEIARTIVDKLKVQLSSRTPLVRRHTGNMEAYNLYLKGRFYWNKRYEIGVQKGMEYFQQAIEKDELYALPYTGLADSYSVLATYNFLPPADGYGKARAAAMKALDLNETLAETHTSAAYVTLFHDWDWQKTESLLRRAIDINPSYAPARYWYAVFLALMRRFEESQAEGTRALDLDPLSPVAGSMMGWVLLLDKHFDLAIAQLKSVLEIEPHAYFAQCFLSMSYAMAYMFDEAIAMMQSAAQVTKNSTLMVLGLAMVQAAAGKVEDAQAVLKQLDKRTDAQYVSPFYRACAYALMSDDDRAIACLEKAFFERDGAMIYLDVFTPLDSLRPDPRFQNILARMQFPGNKAALAAKHR